MATGVLSNSFYPSQMASHYGYLGQAVQGPPSPPLDDSVKCSLPSISNLLDLADQGSPTSETYTHPQQMQQQPPSEFPFYTQASRPSTRPSSSHFSASAIHRGITALPPTPPMSSEASFNSHESPSTKLVNQQPTASSRSPPLSSSSSATTPSVIAATKPGSYYFEATPPPSLEPADHRQQQHRHSQPSLPPYATLQPPSQPQTQQQQRLPTIPYGGSGSATEPPYAINQQTASAMPASYYPPMQSSPPPQPQISALYFQRPLPQALAPLSMTVQPSPWQHHHYISPSAAAAFPQSQDRYICPTCSKAFSRPSSLRIHSHSHTGEKPFKCPHAGCGKAFSVRSNMKRHERGCHNYDGSH